MVKKEPDGMIGANKTEENWFESLTD